MKLLENTGIRECVLEEVWLSALLSRNNVPHAYNEAIALDIIGKTKSMYYKMFLDLQKEMENWI